jgi:hypothetical protein
VPPLAEVSPEQLDADLRAWLDGDLAQLKDPFPLFAALRAQSPVHELGSVVVLSRYGFWVGASAWSACAALRPT